MPLFFTINSFKKMDKQEREMNQTMEHGVVVTMRVGNTDYALVGMDELLPTLQQLLEYREETEEMLVLLLLNWLELAGEHADVAGISYARVLELYEFLRKLSGLVVMVKEVGECESAKVRK